jgi:hypothetical protein
MPKKRFGAEQIVMLLRQIEVAMGSGQIDPNRLPRGRDLGAELLPLA